MYDEKLSDPDIDPAHRLNRISFSSQERKEKIEGGKTEIAEGNHQTNLTARDLFSLGTIISAESGRW